MPNLVGALTIVATAVFFAWTLGASEVGYLAACVIAIALVLVAHHMWTEPSAPQTPIQWARSMALTVVAGSVVFSIEMAVGKLIHPEMGLFEAGLHTGPFGGIATVGVTVIVGVTCFGGFFRCLALKWCDRH